MQTIDILGVPHAYELTAPTPSRAVLVFIHGWLLSRHYWHPLVEQLSPDYQCLSYDLRGFGDSQPCQSATDRPVLVGYGLLDYAEDLALLLKQLHIEQAWLVGHSIGGSVALWGADQLPEQIKGVICVNSGGGIYLKEEFDRFRAVGQQLVKFRPRWLCHIPLLDLPFTRASVTRAIARRWGRQRLLDFVAATPEAALGMLLDSTTEAEVHLLPQVVARLKQPVYFMAGAQDPIMEPKYVRHLASFHRLFHACGDNVVEIGDCGHLAMVEQTAAVANQIRTILAQYDA
ncbi:MAG: alpha/beta hydrolase [Lyngbya sp. HA4199-MV5]|jgi:pimeloyl-ACP methyl ester carboxylesterase|nr:alpha/beta hydrolase [Lyngbya sp. HA4199-MV5]